MLFFRSSTHAFSFAVLLATLLSLAGPAGAVATSTPPPPTNVHVSFVGWQAVEVSWQHAGATPPWSYRVTNQTTGDVWTVAGSSTSAWVQRLEPEQTYVLDVQAVETFFLSQPVRVSTATVAMPQVPPTGPLHVDDVNWNRIDLRWGPSPEPELWGYEVVDVDNGRIVAVTGAPSVQLPARAEVTYRLQVRAARAAVNGQQVHSAPSNMITVTTPEQFVEPAADLRATVDGRDITLTWERTEPGDVEYLVYDGDRLETIVDQQGASAQVTIRRAAAGNRDFTVRTRFRHPLRDGHGVSASSNPAPVSIPQSDDATAPTAPTILWIFHDCATERDWYELEGAVDDVTAVDDITFEAVILLDARTRLPFVRPDGYGIPRTGDWPAPIRHPVGLRAVDEAGNRSKVVQLFVRPVLINC